MTDNEFNQLVNRLYEIATESSSPSCLRNDIFNELVAIKNLQYLRVDKSDRTFFVRQLLVAADRNLMRDVYVSQFENSALRSYEEYRKAHPGQYFELVRVVKAEDCLMHTGEN